MRLEAYAFVPSGFGDRCVEALGQAVKRGVKAEIIIDGSGSIRGGPHFRLARTVQGKSCRTTVKSKARCSIAPALSAALFDGLDSFASE